MWPSLPALCPHPQGSLRPSVLSRIKSKVQSSWEWLTVPVSPQPVFPLSLPLSALHAPPPCTAPPPFWLTSLIPSKLPWGSTTHPQLCPNLLQSSERPFILPHPHSHRASWTAAHSRAARFLHYLPWGPGASRLSPSSTAEQHPSQQQAQEELQSISRWTKESLILLIKCSILYSKTILQKT